MSHSAAERDLHALVAAAPAANAAAEARVRTLAAGAAEAGGPGAELGGALQHLAAWSAADRPLLQRPILALYASSYVWRPDTAATRARLEALAQGEGAANGFARAQGAGVEAFDLALDRPSPDAALGEVMSLREAAATVAFGMEAVAKAPDLLILRAMSAGEGEAAEVLALAAGLAIETTSPWARTAAARAEAAGVEGPLELLRQTSGRETAALLGALLAARAQGLPVLLEGPAALAAAQVAVRLHPSALDHLVGVVETSPVCPLLRRALGLPAPLTAVGGDAGPGVGALAALALLRLAAGLFDL